MKTNSFHSLPFKEIRDIPYEKLINNEQEYSVENSENDYIIPLHTLDDEANIHKNITGKVETHAGDKCSFISVPRDSGMGNNPTTRIVHFQCSFAKESSKLSFRDYLLDLNDINGTIQKCISDINSLNVQKKIDLIKTNCNVSLPLTILFKYIQLVAANKTESRSMQFAETVRIRGGNVTNKIEFIVKIAALYRPRKKSVAHYKKAHNIINGTMKIEIRFHMKKTSREEKTANEVDDIGNFFADIPLHGLEPKLKIYQTGDSKYKFSKDGLKVKIYFTDFPSFKIEVSIYELLNYFSNRSKKLLSQSRIFITVDGIEEPYAKNKLNFLQSVAQKNDWIDKLLLKTWFGNSKLNISSNNQLKHNKIPMTQERRRSSPRHIFPETTKQNIFNIAINDRDILEKVLKHAGNSNDSADERERNSLTNWMGQVFLNSLLNLFVDDTENNEWLDNFMDDIDKNTEIMLPIDELTHHHLHDDNNEPNILDNEFKSKYGHLNWMEEAYTKKKQNFRESNWSDDVLQIVMYGNRKLNFSDYEDNKNDGYVNTVDQEYNKSSFPGKKGDSHSHEYNIDSGNIYKHEISEQEVHNNQKSMYKRNENENAHENLKYETNKPFFKLRENLTLIIMNVSDNAMSFSNFEPNSTLKRIYRDIHQFSLLPSEKYRKRLDKIVMTNQSVMKFLNLIRTPGDQSQSFSNALWFQYRKYSLIPKINETLQQKKLKNSDIFEMLNASISTLKMLKIYNYNCETCSVIYKIMLDSGFKKDPKLMENDNNSSVVVLMNEPQFISHPHKSKIHSSNQNTFKKPGENIDFTIQMNMNLLFLSSDDYEKLNRENAPKNNVLQNSPFKDISKSFAFRIPDNFVSQSKILKLDRLLRHRNLNPAFKDLINQGPFIEELQKIIFALLSKMREDNTKTNMKEINRSMVLPSFSSDVTEFEKIKMSVTVPEGNSSLELNLKEDNLSKNFAVQDSYESYDEISTSIYNSDKGKKMEKFWHQDKTGSFDGYTRHIGTKDVTLSSFDGARKKTSSKAIDYVVQSYESDENNMKYHFEDRKSSNGSASNFENKSHILHFTVTEYLENAPHSAEKINLNKGDYKKINKLLLQQVHDQSEKKNSMTENEPKKSYKFYELKGNDNLTGRASALEKTAITINDELFNPRKESANYEAFQQFKNGVLEKYASKTENIKTWNKTDEKKPNITLAEKSSEFKQTNSAVVQDHGRKSGKRENFNNSEIMDREVLPAENKNLEASRLEQTFSSEKESSKKYLKLGTIVHNFPGTLESETRKLYAKISREHSPEKDHETVKETSNLYKDTLNTATNAFGKGIHKIQDDANYSLNGIVRVRRSLRNSSDISENRNESLFGGVLHFRLNESENLHHRGKRQSGMPNNHWCPIMSMRRNGDLDCNIWTFKKNCVLRCHPGFNYNGRQIVEMTCIRRGNNWKVDVNQPCKPSKGEYLSGEMQFPPENVPDVPPYFRSGGSQPAAQPLTSASKGPNSPSGKNSGSKAAPGKSNDKKVSSPRDSKSPNRVADNSEDDDYYENYDYPEK